MESIRRAGVPHYLGQDVCPSVYGMFKPFKYQYPCTLGRDKSGSIRIERSANLGRIVRAASEGTYDVESALA